MEPRISVITLGVRDLARSTMFYEKGLHLPKRRSKGGSGVAFFELNGSWLALFPRDGLAAEAGVSPVGRGFSGFSLAHNVRTRGEVLSIMEEVVVAGGSIVKQPQEASWGGFCGYFGDPDGYLWEIVWNPGFWPGPE